MIKSHLQSKRRILGAQIRYSVGLSNLEVKELRAKYQALYSKEKTLESRFNKAKDMLVELEASELSELIRLAQLELNGRS